MKAALPGPCSCTNYQAMMSYQSQSHHHIQTPPHAHEHHTLDNAQSAQYYMLRRHSLQSAASKTVYTLPNSNNTSSDNNVVYYIIYIKCLKLYIGQINLHKSQNAFILTGPQPRTPTSWGSKHYISTSMLAIYLLQSRIYEGLQN